MQGLGGENQGVEMEVVFAGIPTSIGDTAELPEQLGEIDIPDQRDTVFAVRGKNVVLRLARMARADLGSFLARERNPQSQFTLPLEGGGFLVEATDPCHVCVEDAKLFRIYPLGVVREDGIGAELSVRAQQLDHVYSFFRRDCRRRRRQSLVSPGGSCVEPIQSPC